MHINTSTCHYLLKMIKLIHWILEHFSPKKSDKIMGFELVFECYAASQDLFDKQSQLYFPLL